MTKKMKYHLMSASVIAFCLAASAPAPEGALVESDEGCLECAQGSHANCQEGYHKATWDGPPAWNAAGGSHPTTCWSGTCQSKHGLCNLEGDVAGTQVLEMLHSALLKQDAAGLSTLLTRYSKEVAVNVERSAIQFTDCAGGVTAHLPISEELIMLIDTRITAVPGLRAASE